MSDGLGSTTTPYLYDTQSGLPMLVDDGTNAYLQQDGALPSIDGSGDPTYLLDDALGSVRGVTDDSGALTGSADYSAFGSLRTGDAFALSYTGEQSDASTGLTYLRARYLDPAVGRFISADTVSPNAPGTQGYNPYAYVGNNPTTWTDPSGHRLASQSLSAIVFTAPALIPTLYEMCAEAKSGFCAVEVDLDITFPIFDCAFDLECVYGAVEDSSIIDEFGSDAVFTDAPETIPELEGTPEDHPQLPEVDP